MLPRCGGGGGGGGGWSARCIGRARVRGLNVVRGAIGQLRGVAAGARELVGVGDLRRLEAHLDELVPQPVLHAHTCNKRARAHTCAWTHTRAHARMHMRVRANYACVRTHTCPHTHARARARTHTHLCTCDANRPALPNSARPIRRPRTMAHGPRNAIRCAMLSNVATLRNVATSRGVAALRGVATVATLRRRRASSSESRRNWHAEHSSKFAHTVHRYATCTPNARNPTQPIHSRTHSRNPTGYTGTPPEPVTARSGPNAAVGSRRPPEHFAILRVI